MFFVPIIYFHVLQRSNLMEEISDSAVLKLLFKSNQVHQLQVHLCDPQEAILRTLTLWNYQEGTLNFFPNHLHYYCTIYQQNNNIHIVELSVPEDRNCVQKNIEFETFTFMVKLSFNDQTKSASNDIMAQYKKIAKYRYQIIKNRVFEVLEKEKYIQKEQQKKMMKIFIRKPKGKKNLTDIFMTRNGQIKGMASTSINNINKFKSIQTPVLQKKEEDSLPELPKLVKMNTSIDDLSRCLSIKDIEKTSKKSSTLHQEVVNLENYSRVEKQQEKAKMKKFPKSYRMMFLKTLERETKDDLNYQKDFNEKSGLILEPEKKKESPSTKKNKTGPIHIYSKSRLRY